MTISNLIIEAVTEAFNLCCNKTAYKSNVLDKINTPRILLGLPPRQVPLQKGQYDKELIDCFMSLPDYLLSAEKKDALSGSVQGALLIAALTGKPLTPASEVNDSTISSSSTTVTTAESGSIDKNVSVTNKNQDEGANSSSNKDTIEDSNINSFISKLASIPEITTIFEVALDLAPDATKNIIEGFKTQAYSSSDLAQVNTLRNTIGLPSLLSIQNGFCDTEFLSKFVKKITNAADIIEMVTEPKVKEQVLNFCSKMNDFINSTSSLSLSIDGSFVETHQQLDHSNHDEKAKLQNIFKLIVDKKICESHNPEDLRKLEALSHLSNGSLGDNLYDEVSIAVELMLLNSEQFNFGSLDLAGEEGMTVAQLFSCLSQ
ncbi:MAG: hypothetical protein EOP33_00945 [Rickettsiaceae bacterium]|nr:MAG: hypothetical protein EOP33_00945 [Rickettsiaceae bacterium]